MTTGPEKKNSPWSNLYEKYSPIPMSGSKVKITFTIHSGSLRLWLAFLISLLTPCLLIIYFSPEHLRDWTILVLSIAHITGTGRTTEKNGTLRKNPNECGNTTQWTAFDNTSVGPSSVTLSQKCNKRSNGSKP